MTDQTTKLELDPITRSSQAAQGGFVALAVIAAAAGAGAALLLTADSGSRVAKQKRRSRGEKRIIALAGLVVGAGLAVLLTPESGPTTRKLLGGTLKRIKVGAVDRIERLRQPNSAEPEAAENPVRSVQELGRDSDSVF
jgi:gas vesicle protein